MSTRDCKEYYISSLSHYAQLGPLKTERFLKNQTKAKTTVLGDMGEYAELFEFPARITCFYEAEVQLV